MSALNVTVADHPLIQHKVTLLRRIETSTAEFRQLLSEIALLLAFEATRDLPLKNTSIKTPLEVMEAPVLDGMKLCLVSILRAANGLLEGMLDLIPMSTHRSPAHLQQSPSEWGILKREMFSYASMKIVN